MTRREWLEIAETFSRLRWRLLDRDHVDHAGGVELAARSLCRTLRSRNARFDGRRFMRIVMSRR